MREFDPTWLYHFLVIQNFNRLPEQRYSRTKTGLRTRTRDAVSNKLRHHFGDSFGGAYSEFRHLGITIYRTPERP